MSMLPMLFTWSTAWHHHGMQRESYPPPCTMTTFKSTCNFGNDGSTPILYIWWEIGWSGSYRPQSGQAFILQVKMLKFQKIRAIFWQPWILIKLDQANCENPHWEIFTSEKYSPWNWKQNFTQENLDAWLRYRRRCKVIRQISG